jgi:hypothetical protein
LPAIGRDSEVIIGKLGRYPAPRSAVQEADLNQKQLVNFFNRVGLFGEPERWADRSCQCCVREHNLAPVTTIDSQSAATSGCREDTCDALVQLLMIAHLRGKVIARHPNQVIVDTMGVGYDVTISVPTFFELPPARG